LVGESHFVYGFNDAELRRSGTHTPKQLERRQQLEARYGRPNPQATRLAVEELVARIVPPGSAVEIRSDDHKTYPIAFGRLRDREIRHQTTPSKATRTPRNPLFPANLADLLLRHGGANHKRKTIAFSKRRQGVLYRAAVWAVWRNYVKSRSERRRDPPPGVAIAAVERRLTVDEILGRRRFPWRQDLSGWLKRCYFGRIPTRSLPRLRVHECAYAI
jgi:hypothetical protein